MPTASRRGPIVDLVAGALVGLAVVAATVMAADGPPGEGRGSPHGRFGAGPGAAEVAVASPWLVMAAVLVAFAVTGRRLRAAPGPRAPGSPVRRSSAGTRTRSGCRSHGRCTTWSATA